MEIITKINQWISDAKSDAQEARSEAELFDLEKKYLGRKNGLLTNVLKSIKELSDSEKKVVGPRANEVKKEILTIINNQRKQLQEKQSQSTKTIDVTLPGKKIVSGHLHPLTIVQNDIVDIFTRMGFDIADGPEVESEWYNFDAVNVPDNHPGRDMQDTFWLRAEKGKKQSLLRTQTSAVQVRYMEKHTPPFHVIVPGRIFRHEATDASHEHTFHQFEALMVGNDISVANCKHVVSVFFSQFFKKDVEIRLRPGFFPFVEPGFEFDISCTVCDAKGCSVCKQAGWLEIGGAGMVHQNVFGASGYEKGKYQGFAWGFGLERLAMMKYNIDDVRLFHSGDLRFINQFR